MSLKGNKINHPASSKRPKNKRRISAYNILEAQLRSGVKPVKKDILADRIPLEENDIIRIKSQMSILQSKIVR